MDSFSLLLVIRRKLGVKLFADPLGFNAHMSMLNSWVNHCHDLRV